MMYGYSGDAEKFYSNFFSLLVVNVLPLKFEDPIITITVMSELANMLLNHLSGVDAVKFGTKEPTKSFSEKEEKSLQYLSGFILHKLYSKFCYSMNRSTHQQFISILQACKVEHGDTQTLINARDWGGLWRVHKKLKKSSYKQSLYFAQEPLPLP